ncbi:uncharacterized protein SPPG_07627 [Spizellomyces punctatus DAOM BR117]|uniref:Uncharacterized protein n=1 Tax=Spizellomyces punctatus (strain DAOM BR117) TaxID=645134 RepID=A0A0L0H8F4_SPIPD|nr:uncharacterized protein SPPG_07627 [Spizellomyces punctatus DAOM BR117]KNC97241.1 hypothetical protein SPPG_07627 [Spizellomyces punctatus DAOM BR117]|eukprot:XP_016605281.1 hypothetical protein SPPG_07627 [Spizellomyces punctatus DAOM BR117]
MQEILLGRHRILWSGQENWTTPYGSEHPTVGRVYQGFYGCCFAVGAAGVYILSGRTPFLTDYDRRPGLSEITYYFMYLNKDRITEATAYVYCSLRDELKKRALDLWRRQDYFAKDRLNLLSAHLGSYYLKVGETRRKDIVKEQSRGKGISAFEQLCRILRALQEECGVVRLSRKHAASLTGEFKNLGGPCWDGVFDFVPIYGSKTEEKVPKVVSSAASRNLFKRELFTFTTLDGVRHMTAKTIILPEYRCRFGRGWETEYEENNSIHVQVVISADGLEVQTKTDVDTARLLMNEKPILLVHELVILATFRGKEPTRHIDYMWGPIWQWMGMGR